MSQILPSANHRAGSLSFGVISVSQPYFATGPKRDDCYTLFVPLRSCIPSFIRLSRNFFPPSAPLRICLFTPPNHVKRAWGARGGGRHRPLIFRLTHFMNHVGGMRLGWDAGVYNMVQLPLTGSLPFHFLFGDWFLKRVGGFRDTRFGFLVLAFA